MPSNDQLTVRQKAIIQRSARLVLLSVPTIVFSGRDGRILALSQRAVVSLAAKCSAHSCRMRPANTSSNLRGISGQFAESFRSGSYPANPSPCSAS